MDAGRCATPAYRRLRAERRGERLTANAPTRSVLAGPPQARPHTGCGLAPSRPSVTLVCTVCLAALFEVSVPGEGLLTHSRHSLTLPLSRKSRCGGRRGGDSGGGSERSGPSSSLSDSCLIRLSGSERSGQIGRSLCEGRRDDDSSVHEVDKGRRDDDSSVHEVDEGRRDDDSSAAAGGADASAEGAATGTPAAGAGALAAGAGS